MTDEHLDDALSDLRAELTVTPSPEFAAKVRERIDRPAAVHFGSGAWAWLGVAATCAAAVIAVAVWRSGVPSDAGRGVQSDVGRAFRPGGNGAVEAPPHTEGTVQPNVGRPFTVRQAHGAGGPPARVAVAAAKRAEPEVLVPQDQLIAIRRLMAAMRAGAQPNLPASPALFDPDTGELIPLKPIEIPLITVDPLPGTPDGRSGGRENR